MTEVLERATSKLMTAEQVCEHLVVSKDFLYDEVKAGRIKAAKIGRHLRFRPEDVETYIDANAVTREF